MEKANWQVQHQMDNEPTYICDVANDPEGDYGIALHPKMDKDGDSTYRRQVAQQIANILNGNKILTAATAAYARLSEFRNNWPGRGSIEGQLLLCNLRDAIAEETGQTAQQVQESH